MNNNKKKNKQIPYITWQNTYFHTLYADLFYDEKYIRTT